MRMVRSRPFFEQMKGRGVRVINSTDLQGVTPDAKVKDRFVIVDAVGVTEADLHDTTPMDRNPKLGFEKLLHNLARIAYRSPQPATVEARPRGVRSRRGCAAEEARRVHRTPTGSTKPRSA